MSTRKFEELKKQTQNVALIWKCTRGVSPANVANDLDKAMLNWMSSLTDSLGIWISKGVNMTDGELILARANFGSVVESWLRLYYTIYQDDYNKNPFKDKNGNAVRREKLRFVDLQEHSTGILWANKNSWEYLWIDSARNKRNAIHSFEFKNIGTPMDFINDIDKLYDFVDSIIEKFPPVEDIIDTLPNGYVWNPCSS